MYSPNWFHGFLPENWWPDRPREFFEYGVNVIPIAANDTVTLELALAKKNDVIVFGGCALVTDAANGTTIQSPIAASFAQKLVELYNPAGNVTYTQRFLGTGNAPNNRVPIEHLFSPWQHPADQAAYWPMPITVKKGGSLGMVMQNISPGRADHVRLTFWCCLLYDHAMPEAA